MRGPRIYCLICLFSMWFLCVFSAEDNSLSELLNSKKFPERIVTKIDSSEMVLVPGGEFLMGNNPSQNSKSSEILGKYKSLTGKKYKDESPEHTVYIDTFYIDKYEITNDQYKKFIKATKHRRPGLWKIDYFKNPNQPVVGVSYDDAKAYAQWAGKRLPTEAEWEKAARGTDGRRYSWEGKLGKGKTNCKKEKLNQPSFVGKFTDDVSPYGAYDMSGNVSEWVEDWYDAKFYANCPEKNPVCLTKGDARVVRGGNYLSNLRMLRTYARSRYNPKDTIGEIGFRCVLDLKEKERPNGVVLTDKELKESIYHSDSTYIQEFERIFRTGSVLPFSYKEQKHTAAGSYTVDRYYDGGAVRTTRQYYNAGVRGSIRVVNHTDSEISLCILNSTDEVCHYNEIINKNSSRHFSLVGYSNYRTYIKYLDDFETIYRSGTFELDLNYDYKTTLIFDVGGRYPQTGASEEERKSFEEISKVRFSVQRGEYQPEFNTIRLLNKTPREIRTTILDMGTMMPKEAFTLEPLSIAKQSLSNGKYQVLTQYSNVKEKIYKGKPFTISRSKRGITIAYTDNFTEYKASGSVETTPMDSTDPLFIIYWIHP